MTLNVKERLGAALDSTKGQNAAALLFVMIFFVINALSVQGKHWTYDEEDHYQYGTNILNGDSTRFDDSKMPVSAWNALPAKAASFLPDGAAAGFLRKLPTARMMTVIFASFIAFMVFYWARKLYGFLPALGSLWLYVFDPNIIGHSQLSTTDIYATGTLLLCAYWLWKFAHSREPRDGLILAAMLGLAQLAKYTSVSYIPVMGAALIAHDIPRLKSAFETRGSWGVAKEAWRYVKYALAAAVVCVVVINIGFLFNDTFTWLGDYEFRSTFFQSIQTKINFPVPTPYPYLQGFDWILYKERMSAGFGNIYLFGRIWPQGVYGYYFFASLLKTPIGTQILLWLAFLAYVADAKCRLAFWKDEWFLLWPVFFYTFYFNFLYNVQIGIRYYLIVFPLLYAFAGSLFQKVFQRVRRGMTSSMMPAAGALALCLYLLGSTLAHYPDYIAYFNEIVWNRIDAYKYLADSNLDWGQDYYVFKEYRAQHRDVDKAPEVPLRISKTKTYFVPVNQLVGVTYDPSTYAWLRENFEPSGMIAPSYLLYTVTPEQMEELCARMRCEWEK